MIFLLATIRRAKSTLCRPLLTLSMTLSLLLWHIPNAIAASEIYLLRHAEKLLGDDPALTREGQQRAQWLATWFKDIPVTTIYSSEYLRTQQTVMPLANTKLLPIKSYDPRKLAEFSTLLQQQPGIIVVVGHSNTTPKLVGLLGGDPGQAIDEEHEFDRLYQLTFGVGTVTTQRWVSGVSGDQHSAKQAPPPAK